MNKLDEADFAWKAWNLLVDIETFLWERYEKHFLDFIIEEQDEELRDQLPSLDFIPASD